MGCPEPLASFPLGVSEETMEKLVVGRSRLGPPGLRALLPGGGALVLAQGPFRKPPRKPQPHGKGRPRQGLAPVAAFFQ